MATPQPTRKARFKASLALAGMTEKEWREQRERPVTPQHLHAVLSGQRESAPLIADVDAFIAEHAPQTAAA